MHTVIASFKPTNTSQSPYPFWVIDDFLQPNILNDVLAEWLPLNDERWFHGVAEVDGKKNILETGRHTIYQNAGFPQAVNSVFTTVNSPEFVRHIESITGHTNLQTDDTYRWTGMATMETNSQQLIHSDALVNPISGLHRAFTALIYLNPDYAKETDGGCLELWNADMSRCEHEIEPINNRFVLFECGETSYHGVPHVKKERHNLMWAYMTQGGGKRERALFVPRPQDGVDVRELGKKRSVY